MQKETEAVSSKKIRKGRPNKRWENRLDGIGTNYGKALREMIFSFKIETGTNE